jgi:hypothetical protein
MDVRYWTLHSPQWPRATHNQHHLDYRGPVYEFLTFSISNSIRRSLCYMPDGRLVTISNQVKQLQFPGPPPTQKKQEPEKLAMINIDSRLCLLKI